MGSLGENRHAVLLSDDVLTISDLTIDVVSDLATAVHQCRSDLTTIHSNEWSGRVAANESVDENEH